MEHDGPVLVVTGAARGIGRAIAGAFAESGARVALVDVLSDELAQTATEMRDRGFEVLPVVCDTTDPAQVQAMASQVEADLGPADTLINNAGTFSVIAPVWEADPDLWLRDIRVNLYGSFLCARAFVARMVARGHGRVINIVSSGGVGDPHAYSTSYACSKTALMRLTEGLAAEAREYGVSVFALAPPAILTDMTTFIMEDPGGRRWRPGFSRLFEEGRDAPAELVAKYAVRLSSGEADALTGRYFLVTKDLDEILAQREDVLRADRLTLRIRP